jgi:hypothetical protein
LRELKVESGENEKINEIARTQVRSPPRATSLKKLTLTILFSKSFVLQFLKDCFVGVGCECA